MSKFRCEYDIPTVSYSQIFLTGLFRLRIPCSKSALFFRCKNFSHLHYENGSIGRLCTDRPVFCPKNNFYKPNFRNDII